MGKTRRHSRDTTRGKTLRISGGSKTTSPKAKRAPRMPNKKPSAENFEKWELWLDGYVKRKGIRLRYPFTTLAEYRERVIRELHAEYGGQPGGEEEWERLSKAYGKEVMNNRLKNNYIFEVLKYINYDGKLSFKDKDPFKMETYHGRPNLA